MTLKGGVDPCLRIQASEAETSLAFGSQTLPVAGARTHKGNVEEGANAGAEDARVRS